MRIVVRERGDIIEDSQDFCLADCPEGQQKEGGGLRQGRRIMNLTRRPNNTQVETLIFGQQLEIETWNLGGSQEKDTGLEAGSAETLPESFGVGWIIEAESRRENRRSRGETSHNTCM